MTGLGDGSLSADPRHHVNAYFRVEGREVPPDAAEVDGSAPSTIVGRVPLDDAVRGPGGGLRTGALVTVLDSLGGLLSGLAVLPRWIVTTNMLVSVAELAHEGPLRVTGRVVRRGRRAVVAALEITDEGRDHRPVAVATMTSAVLDPGGLVLEFARPVVIATPPAHGDTRTPEEFFCIEPGEGPLTRLRLEDRLRNPWGILHGGALAVLADVAACRSVESARTGGHRAAASDSVLHYLRPARIGPVEARAEVVGRQEGRAVVRVGVHDAGADGRLVLLASVSVLDR